LSLLRGCINRWKGRALKQWSDENPKAPLMRQKRAAIVRAAKDLFLQGGYVKTSMDAIADLARVGIKTVYRHFENKDELFSEVMRAACTPELLDELTDAPALAESSAKDRSWFSAPPSKALALAGLEYLQHALSSEQLALYRVVTQDAHLFPELGRHYKDQVIEGRNAIFASYLDRWARSEGWDIRDPHAAANTFSALLRAGIFDEALHGTRQPQEPEIEERARAAARQMLTLLERGQL